MGGNKKYPKYLNEFLNELQIKLIRSLKRSSSIKKGSMMISNRVENYLIKYFQITNRMQPSNILQILGLDQKIIKYHSDTEPASVTNFTIRLGNKSVCSYIALGPINRELISNSCFHWRFIREVEMNEISEIEINSRYQKAVQEHQLEIISNSKYK